MIRTLCLGMHQNTEDSSLEMMTMSISSLPLVVLLQETIVVLWLPLNDAHVILGCIFSMLFSDFKARILRSIPTPPMTALKEIFHADRHKRPSITSIMGFYF